MSSIVVRMASRVRRAPHIWVFHDIDDATWFDSCITEITSTRDVLPLTDLARNRSHQNACAITFDDGRRSVLEVAHPVLRKHGIPYTLFVSTEVLTEGKSPWFTRLGHLIDSLGLSAVKSGWRRTDGMSGGRTEFITALKALPFDAVLEGLDALEATYSIHPPDPSSLFLTAIEVRQLSEDGAVIGAHSHRHPILSHLDSNEQKAEVDTSVDLVAAITGRRPIEFAYPNGSRFDFNEHTFEALRDAGILFAVTTDQRYLSAGDEALALPRMGLCSGTSSARRALKSIAPSLSVSGIRAHRQRRAHQTQAA